MTRLHWIRRLRSRRVLRPAAALLLTAAVFAAAGTGVAEARRRTAKWPYVLKGGLFVKTEKTYYDEQPGLTTDSRTEDILAFQDVVLFLDNIRNPSYDTWTAGTGSYPQVGTFAAEKLSRQENHWIRYGEPCESILTFHATREDVPVVDEASQGARIEAVRPLAGGRWLVDVFASVPIRWRGTRTSTCDGADDFPETLTHVDARAQGVIEQTRRGGRAGVILRGQRTYQLPNSRWLVKESLQGTFYPVQGR